MKRRKIGRLKNKSLRKKKLLKSHSKQNKIVLKIPTMISVWVQNPIFKIENKEEENYSDDFDTPTSKRRHSRKSSRVKSKRYKPVSNNYQTVDNSKNKGSRKELKITESNINANVHIPSQAVQKPIVKNLQRKKLVKRNNQLLEWAITQLRKSKEYQTISILDDKTKGEFSEYQTKASMKINEKSKPLISSLNNDVRNHSFYF